jgi:hypothetical protein
VKENGFLQLRRGIWEHVRNGQMNVNMLAVYIYILSEADTRTGTWKGCAQSLASALRIPLSTAKYALSKLDGVYLRRFMVRGRRFCYPIVCHKFVLTNGPDVGRMIDALNSTNEKTLAFFPRSVSPDILPETSLMLALRRELRIKKRERRKNPAAKPTPPADPRFQPFLEFAYKSFEEKHGAKPSWLGKDFSNLRLLLKANGALSGDELQRRWRNYLDSTEPFVLKQGNGLAYFATHCDTFSNGPILIGGKNGHKPSGSELLAHNLRIAGFRAPEPTH